MSISVLKAMKAQFEHIVKSCGINITLHDRKNILWVDNTDIPVCPVSGVVLDDEDIAVTTLLPKLTGRQIVKVWGCIPSYTHEYITKCRDCGMITTSGFKVHDGGYVCRKCLGENYFECASCGAYHPLSEAHFVNGLGYCATCTRNYIYKCPECGKEFYSNWAIEIDGETTSLCCECLTLKYDQCQKCGKYFKKGDPSISLYVDELICDKCKNNIMSSIDHGMIGYHCFNSSKYKIGRRYMPGEKGKDLLYYGIELETERCYMDDIDVDSWVNDGNLVHAESDGSLDDDTGVEWITMPCTLAYHRSEFGWNEFCKELVRNGTISHNSSNCGLHIHVNRDGLTPSVIAKMDFLINRMKMLGIILARRNSFYSSDYSSSKALEWSVGYWDEVQKGLMDNICKRKGYSYSVRTGRDLSHDERYRAVNVTNPYTVEVRIFRGTLNPETIIATLEYVDAVIAFAKTARQMLFKRNIKNSVLCHEFIKFLYDNAKKYPTILPTLRRLSSRSSWKGTALRMTYDEVEGVLNHINSNQYRFSNTNQSCVENDGVEVYDDDDDDDDCHSDDEEC